MTEPTVVHINAIYGEFRDSLALDEDQDLSHKDFPLFARFMRENYPRWCDAAYDIWLELQDNGAWFWDLAALYQEFKGHLCLKRSDEITRVDFFEFIRFMEQRYQVGPDIARGIWEDFKPGMKDPLQIAFIPTERIFIEYVEYCSLLEVGQLPSTIPEYSRFQRWLTGNHPSAAALWAVIWASEAYVEED